MGRLIQDCPIPSAMIAPSKKQAVPAGRMSQQEPQPPPELSNEQYGEDGKRAWKGVPGCRESRERAECDRPGREVGPEEASSAKSDLTPVLKA